MAIPFSMEEFKEERKELKRKGQRELLYKECDVHITTVGELKDFLKDIDNNTFINIILRGENELGYVADGGTVFAEYDINGQTLNTTADLMDIA